MTIHSLDSWLLAYDELDVEDSASVLIDGYTGALSNAELANELRRESRRVSGDATWVRRRRAILLRAADRLEGR